MEKSKVYFTNLRTQGEESLLKKLERLMKKAGFEEIDFKDKFVAVKIHFGELGNLAHLRPQSARVVTDYIRERGGKPFLTDCNTLYVGSRKNALDQACVDLCNKMPVCEGSRQYELVRMV